MQNNMTDTLAIAMKKFFLFGFFLLPLVSCAPVHYISNFDKLGSKYHKDVFMQMQKVGIYSHVYGDFRFSTYHEDEKSFREIPEKDRSEFISEVNSRLIEILTGELSKEGYEVIILTRDMLKELGLKTTHMLENYRFGEIEKYIRRICASAGVDAVLAPVIEFQDDGLFVGEGLISGELGMTVNIRMMFYCPLDRFAFGINCWAHIKNVNLFLISEEVSGKVTKETYRVNWFWEATPERVIKEACRCCRKLWSDRILTGNIEWDTTKDYYCRYFGWEIVE